MNKKQLLGQSRVQQLIQDLRDSGETRKQNFSSLAMGNGKQVKTYCALGAIGCEKKIVGYGNSKAKPENFGIQEPPYQVIIEAYGLEDTLSHAVPFSYLSDRKSKGEIVTQTSSRISVIIPELNDYGRYTFSEIADYLEELATTGVFVPCSQKKWKDTQRYLLEDIE